MLVKKVLIEAQIQEKAFRKHGVRRAEMEEALLDDEPKYFRVSEGRHMALAKVFQQYLTVIFVHRRNVARIVTAYPSSDWQIRLYQRK